MIGSGIAMLFLAWALASPLARVFVGYDAQLFDLTRQALVIYAFAFTLYGLNIFASSFFTALNNGAVSAAISAIACFSDDGRAVPSGFVWSGRHLVGGYGSRGFSGSCFCVFYRIQEKTVSLSGRLSRMVFGPFQFTRRHPYRYSGGS